MDTNLKNLENKNKSEKQLMQEECNKIKRYLEDKSNQIIEIKNTHREELNALKKSLEEKNSMNIQLQKSNEQSRKYSDLFHKMNTMLQSCQSPKKEEYF